MDWIRHQGVPPTFGTGPETDHTYENISDQGYYMYMEASRRKRGHKARLISPAFLPSRTEICFEFWYHMQSPTKVTQMGKLEVFVSQNGDNINSKEPVFRVAGNQGDKWHHGNFVIRKVKSPFNIIIIATRGSHFKGDIAIDDVRLYNCSEGDHIGETTVNQLQMQTQTTNTSDNPVTENVTEQSRSYSNATINGSLEPRPTEDKVRTFSREVLVPWQIVCFVFGSILVIFVVGLLILRKRLKTTAINTAV